MPTGPETTFPPDGSTTSTTTTTGTTTTDKIVIDSPNWGTAAKLEEGAGFVTTLIVVRGTVYVELGSVTYYKQTYRTNVFGDANVIWTSVDAKMPLYWHINGGRLRIALLTQFAGLPWIFVSGGRVEFTEDSTASLLFIHQSGGVIDARGTGYSIDQVFLLGGVLTMLEDTRPKTITDLLVMPGAQALLPETIIVTNGG